MGRAQYARQAVDTYDTPWLADLPWATRMVWTPLVLAMKKSGGVLANMTPEKFAVLVDAPPKAVREFVSAATAKGSLVIEGRDWSLKNYEEWQTDKTVSDRVRAHRERQRNGSASRNGPVTETGCNAGETSDGTGGNGNETRYTTVTETPRNDEVTPPINEKRETRNDPVSPDGLTVAGGDQPAADGAGISPWRSLEDPLPELPPEGSDWFGRVAWTLRTIQEKAQWKAVLAPDVRRHVGQDKPVRALIELYGEVDTVAIFLFAHATWSAEKRPTWSAVLDQREQLRERMRTFQPDRDDVPEKPATSAMSNRDLAREMIAIVAARRASR